MKALKRLMGCKHSSQQSLDIDVSASPNSIDLIDNGAVNKRAIPTKLDKSMFVLGFILGEGGFGKVSGGICVKNQKWYAVKEVHKSTLLQHKTGVPMILNELRSMARVDHPNVIKLHFAFQDKRKCYFVMDLQIGGDLRYYLRKRYLFEEIDVAFYVACMSSALNHLHSRGIIHRDIKPENILLDERGYPYLTDFGVAHLHHEWDHILSSNLASGTKQYLAPEVFTKTHLHGPEVDFWSLGVVAYELLWGKRPFDKHVPVPMITYLEKALLAKRRQLKEVKMRQMMSLSSHTNTATHSNTNSNLFAIDSQETNNHATNNNNNNTHQISLHQIRLAGLESSSTVKPEAPPRIRGSINNRHSGRSSIISTSTSTASERHTLYCSSVQYTLPNNSQTQQSNSHSMSNLNLHPHQPSEKLSRFGSFDSEDGQQSHGNNTPTGQHRLLPGPLSPDRYSSKYTSSSLGSPGQVYNTNLSPSKESMSIKLPFVTNGGSNNHASMSIPKPLFSKSSNHFEHQGMMQIAIANNYHNTNAGSSTDNLTENPSFHSRSGGIRNSQSMVIEEFEDTTEKMNRAKLHLQEQDGGGEGLDDDIEESSSSHGFKPGDHWLVDEIAELPDSLRVDIPAMNPWLGELSPPCVDVLQGLFDIRPSHRYGGRNMHLLEQHDWFAMYDISFDAVLSKTFHPHFKPGGKFIKKAAAIMEEMSKQDYDVGESQQDYEDHTLYENEMEIHPEQQALFDDFRYIAMQYHHLFPHDVSLHRPLA